PVNQNAIQLPQSSLVPDVRHRLHPEPVAELGQVEAARRDWRAVRIEGPTRLVDAAAGPRLIADGAAAADAPILRPRRPLDDESVRYAVPGHPPTDGPPMAGTKNAPVHQIDIARDIGPVHQQTGSPPLVGFAGDARGRLEVQEDDRPDVRRLGERVVYALGVGRFGADQERLRAADPEVAWLGRRDTGDRVVQNHSIESDALGGITHAEAAPEVLAEDVLRPSVDDGVD